VMVCSHRLQCVWVHVEEAGALDTREVEGRIRPTTL
jgi:hypothetical protein